MAFSGGKNCKVYINGVDLSAFFHEAGISGSADLADVTTFGKTARCRIALLSDGSLSLSGYADYTDDMVNEQITNLIGDDNTIYSVFPLADAVGAAGFGLLANQGECSFKSPVDGVVTIDATAQSNRSAEWVTSLHALAAETAGITGTIVDNTTATTAGGAVYLHCSAFDGVTMTVTVRHSTDNFATDDTLLATFTATTTAPSAQRVEITGTIKRYVRIVTTFTGTSATFCVGLARF